MASPGLTDMRLYPLEVHSRVIMDAKAILAYLNAPERQILVLLQNNVVRALLTKRQRRNFMAWVRRHRHVTFLLEVDLAKQPIDVIVMPKGVRPAAEQAALWE